MDRRIRKLIAAVLAAVMVLSLAGCGEKKGVENPQQVVLELYAPTDSVLVVSNLTDRFTSENETIGIRVIYEDSAMLAALIEAGYYADIYIADNAAHMDWLDASAGEDGELRERETEEEANPNKNDKIDSSTRGDVFKGTVEVAPDPTPEYDENDQLIEKQPTYEERTFSAALVKSSKHPEEAKAFLDFIRDKEAVGQLFDGIDFEFID